MTLAQKAAVMDDVHEQQPHMLGSLLVQQQLGVSLERMDVRANILLICFLAMQKARRRWPVITEDLIEQQMDRFVGAMQFQSALSKDIGERALGEYISQHSEQPLLAIVNAELTAGLAGPAPRESDRHLMVAAINYVNCIANVPLPSVARGTRPRRRPGRRLRDPRRAAPAKSSGPSGLRVGLLRCRRAVMPARVGGEARRPACPTSQCQHSAPDAPPSTSGGGFHLTPTTVDLSWSSVHVSNHQVGLRSGRRACRHRHGLRRLEWETTIALAGALIQPIARQAGVSDGDDRDVDWARRSIHALASPKRRRLTTSCDRPAAVHWGPHFGEPRQRHAHRIVIENAHLSLGGALAPRPLAHGLANGRNAW